MSDRVVRRPAPTSRRQVCAAATVPDLDPGVAASPTPLQPRVCAACCFIVKGFPFKSDSTLEPLFILAPIHTEEDEKKINYRKDFFVVVVVDFNLEFLTLTSKF